MNLQELLLSPDYTNVLVAYQIMQHMDEVELCDALIATANEAIGAEIYMSGVLSDRLVTINQLVKVEMFHRRLYLKESSGISVVLICSGSIMIRKVYEDFFKIKASVITVDGKTTYDIHEHFKQQLIYELTRTTI